MTTFLVERNAPGVSVGKPLRKLGQRAAPAAEVFFDNVVVHASAMLGNEGQGFNVAMKVFDRSRPMVAVSAVGLLQRCLDESLKYASERKTMGKAIIEHQAIGHKIADMGMRLEAARLLAYQAAWWCDQGERNTLKAAYAKAFAADGRRHRRRFTATLPRRIAQIRERTQNHGQGDYRTSSHRP